MLDTLALETPRGQEPRLRPRDNARPRTGSKARKRIECRVKSTVGCFTYIPSGGH